MVRRTVSMIAALCVLAPALAAIAAPVRAEPAPRQTGVTSIRADVSCHDPCDDPFWLKAYVRGDSVAGLRVTFTVKGRTLTARCDASGYAHAHLQVRPTAYPQGVLVKVTAAVRHDGVKRVGSTWFKPNYN